MSRIGLYFSLVAAALFLSAAAGQDYALGTDSVARDQTITVRVPNRVALHLTQTSWSLNLTNPPAGSGTTRDNRVGCYLVQKDDTRTFQQLVEAARSGQLYPTDRYPAVIDATNDGVIDSVTTNGKITYLKGGLLCLNYKIVQKFCNRGQCELDAKVFYDGPETAYGRFFLGDEPIGFTPTRHTPFWEVPRLTAATSGVEGELFFNNAKASGAQRMPAWVDDLVYEGFWFDGTEVATSSNNSHSFVVQFRMSGAF